MTLQTRTIFMVIFVLVVAVIVTAGVLAWTTHQALLAETEREGLLIARLLAQTAEFYTEITDDVEDMLAQQMVVEATIAAHLVGVAEAAGVSPEEINTQLRAIIESTVLNEFWISDEKGHAYLRSNPVDFTFSPSPNEQPQAHIFWPLLTGEARVVIQEARRREIDLQVFKYVGVAGVDKPRIVQVGYRTAFLEKLRERVGLTRLVEGLVVRGNVIALRIVDEGIVTLAYSAVPGRGISPELDEKDVANLRAVVSQGRPLSYVDGPTLKVIAPMHSVEETGLIGAAFVQLPTDHLQAALHRNLQLTGAVAVLVLAVGVAGSMILARRVTGPVSLLTSAAVAVETGAFEPESLDDVAARPDELGQLGRVFQHMARTVYAREERLRQQIHELQFGIDEAKKERQVAEITDTEYFQELRKKANELRKRTEGSDK